MALGASGASTLYWLATVELTSTIVCLMKRVYMMVRDWSRTSRTMTSIFHAVSPSLSLRVSEQINKSCVCTSCRNQGAPDPELMNAIG